MENLNTSKAEIMKEQSQYLRGTIAEELNQDAPFSEDNALLIKLHGMYQQHDRDVRGKKDHTIMVRLRIPGGQINTEQYLALDALSAHFSNGTMRITTRQTVQFHGVVKGNVKHLLKEAQKVSLTSLGACGDLVRNVIACPAPLHNHASFQIVEYARKISEHFLPVGNAYEEIWLDGQKIDLSEPEEKIEPFYGKTYLPRKFKIALAYPGDNCSDIFTNDVGIVAIVENEVLKGFNILVGGGMGIKHNQAETFPRLSDAFGFVEPGQLIQVLEQIVAVYRDNGDRSNRNHARIKYLIEEWGVDRFRAEVEARLGFQIASSAPLPPFEPHLHLGWQDQGDGKYFYGLSVENGRIRDTDSMRLKSALAEIARTFKPSFAFTANQDILITHLPPEAWHPIEEIFRAHGVRLPDELSQVQVHSMACVALPTCSLAITEAERVLPGVIDDLEQELVRLGLQDEPITVRMTGCPNGCVRPYVAEIGIIGRSLNKYAIYLGGRNNGTRLNKLYKDLIPVSEIVPTLVPLLAYYKNNRQEWETFGDFCVRVGIEELQTIQAV